MEMLSQSSNFDMPQSGLQRKDGKSPGKMSLEPSAQGLLMSPLTSRTGFSTLKPSPPKAHQEESCTYSFLKNNVMFCPHYMSPQQSIPHNAERQSITIVNHLVKNSGRRRLAQDTSGSGEAMINVC